MTHWAEKYVGRPWTEEFDCAALVVTVQREQFGRDVEFPGYFDWRRTSPDKVVDLSRDVVYPVEGEPADGDAVLMKITGARRDLGSHIGVVAIVQGSVWVLHNLRGVGVLFHPLSGVHRTQLAVVGYFRFR